MKELKKSQVVMLIVIGLFLTCTTVGLKYIVPPCYRMDLSMAPVLMVSSCCLKNRYERLLLLLVKEVATIFLGNPGIGFLEHLGLTAMGLVFDILMLEMWMIVSDKTGWEKATVFIWAAMTYALAGVVLNAVVVAKLLSEAWYVDIQWLVSYAGMYNVRVTNFYSFLIHTVKDFYVSKFLFTGLLSFLLKRVFASE